MDVTAKQRINKVTAGSLLVALGIIYGDIGTSPLYVLKAIVNDRIISKELIYGGISCVFWTLVLQTSIKYIWLTLRADNQGEGGVFSLYALVRRYGKKLWIPAIIGATTLLADGIITPPISVASAVEGLTMIEGLEQIPTVPIVVIILSILFFFQRFGTQKVGSIFGPIMVVWFTMLFVLGFKELISHPQILSALNPLYAFDLLVKYPSGFWLLGAVFLATTGAEALYSDLGHCGRKNIRITWGFVKICLLMNYLGQGAWLMKSEGSFLKGMNPFFEMMPAWFLLIGIVIATAATIIASQALISGSYTLISEAMNLNFWPKVTLRQPSNLKGQIYIPSVNTILWIGCVLMILYFRSSTHMEAAYGFSITITMIMTTILLSYFLRFKLKWPLWIVIGMLVFFGTVEISFFVANVAKIKERWMFLFFELGIFLVMYSWYVGKGISRQYEKYLDLGKYLPKLKQLKADGNVPKTANHLVYMTKAKSPYEIEKRIIDSILIKRPKRAEVYWFIHINRTEEPFTLNYTVKSLVDQCVYSLNLNIGFRVKLRTEQYIKQIIPQLIEQGMLAIQFSKNECQYREDLDVLFIIQEKYLSVENEFGL